MSFETERSDGTRVQFIRQLILCNNLVAKYVGEYLDCQYRFLRVAVFYVTGCLKALKILSFGVPVVLWLI